MKNLNTRERFLLKELTGEATGCAANNDDWPCGTCFFGMSDELTNSDWQNYLWLRGTSKQSELDNLPKDREASYEKIIRVALANLENPAIEEDDTAPLDTASRVVSWAWFVVPFLLFGGSALLLRTEPLEAIWLMLVALLLRQMT